MQNFGGTRKDIIVFLKKAYSASFQLDTHKILSRWDLCFVSQNMAESLVLTLNWL